MREAGARDFGESRVQDALAKMAEVPEADIRWHMIGRLQTNKAAKVVGRFALVHSVDSLRLAQALSRAASSAERVQDILIEVNVSGEGSKAGVGVEDAERMVEQIQALPAIRVTGLMTMAPLSDDPEKSRPCFAGLRELRDRISSSLRIPLPHLSMGMSQDFEVAIEEGADIVRVGSALFQES